MRTKLVCIAAAFLLFGGQAHAQRLGLGPQVGFYKSAGADQGEYMFGGAMRAKLSPVIAVEGSINYKKEEYAEGAYTVQNWPLMATGMLYPLPFLYGAVGAGWYSSTVDLNNTDAVSPGDVVEETTREFGWHFGGGLELPFGEKSRITGDIRYVFIDYKFEEVPGLGNIDSDFFVVNAGILFFF